MNIFYLDKDPRVCAEYHVDKHVVKMILEYCQLLSTAHRIIDGKESVEKKYVQGSLPARYRNVKHWILTDERETTLYSATHINHPSAVWVRRSYENYVWLYQLFTELLKEYTYRYGKTHACARLVEDLYTPPTHIAKGIGFTEPTPAMPDDYKVPGNSIQSYKNYYLGDKQRMFSWKNREKPSWV